MQRLKFTLFFSIAFSNNIPRLVYSLVQVLGSCGFTGSVLVSLFVSLLGIDVIALKGFELAAVIPAGKCWKVFMGAARCVSLVIKGFVLAVFSWCPNEELAVVD